MKYRGWTFLLIGALAACGTQSKKAVTKPVLSDSSSTTEIFENAGIPESPKFEYDVQGLDTLKSDKPTTATSNTEVVADMPDKPVVKPPVADKPPAKPPAKQNKAPWKIDDPISPEEGQQLQADFDQAFEHMNAANEGRNKEKNYKEAAKYFIKASRVPDKQFRSTCLYNVACCYSLLKQKKKAIKFFDLSLEFGFDNLEHIQKDGDLDNIRNEKGFKQALKKHGLIKNGAAKKSDEPEAKAGTQKMPETSKDDEMKKAYERAESLYDQKKFLQAAKYYLKSAPLKDRTKVSYYNAACCYSLAGKTEKALEALKMAVKAGWDDKKQIMQDPDLENLRKTEAFKKEFAK